MIVHQIVISVFQVICDELEIPLDSCKPVLDQTLNSLKEHSKGVLLAFSANCLIAEDSKPTEDLLKPYLEKMKYKLVTLTNIMRNSYNIFRASSPSNVDRLTSNCSTVEGNKPTLHLYKQEDFQPKKIADILNTHLAKLKRDRIVILCDHDCKGSPSPRSLKPHLSYSDNIILYDSGVDFNGDEVISNNSNLAEQRKEIKKWLDNGGILLTYVKLFKGCEAEAVVLISNLRRETTSISGYFREGPTRAVSDLCLVSNQCIYNDGSKAWLEENYNVMHVSDDEVKL